VGQERKLIVERHGQRTKLLLAGIIGWCAVLTPNAASQLPVPCSLSSAPGVHIRSFDARTHHPADYYEALRAVVLKEFHLPPDSSAINLVFITNELRESLNAGNPARFGTADWTGAFLTPSLIFIVGSEESDDTFMHEYMHSLQVRGLMFTDLPHGVVHDAISQDEGLLLGSDSYLQFLKTHRR
jgi:hypothetical protein